MPKKVNLIHEISKISHTPPPRSVASLPSFGPSMTNPGYTTVTGIAKAQRHKLKKMGNRGLVYGTSHNLSIIMTFNMLRSLALAPPGYAGGRAIIRGKPRGGGGTSICMHIGYVPRERPPFSALNIRSGAYNFHKLPKNPFRSITMFHFLAGTPPPPPPAPQMTIGIWVSITKEMVL